MYIHFFTLIEPSHLPKSFNTRTRLKRETQIPILHTLPHSPLLIPQPAVPVIHTHHVIHPVHHVHIKTIRFDNAPEPVYGIAMRYRKFYDCNDPGQDCEELERDGKIVQCGDLQRFR